jgi:hypothetical protein
MNKEDSIRILSDMLSNRCTPENITSLKPNQVFVFGSKPNGHHKSGAAKIAKEKFGAIDGVGEGFNGNSYAIEVHKRHLKKMAISILKFIDFAKKNRDLYFLVIPIGCGSAGLPESFIAHLFVDAIYVNNIFLPKSFITQLYNPISYYRIRGQRYGILQILLQKKSNGPKIDIVQLELLACLLKEQLIKEYPREMEIVERLSIIEDSYRGSSLYENEERDMLLGRQDAIALYERDVDWKYLFLIDSPDDTKLAKDGYILNSDNAGNHRIAFTNKRAAVAFGKVLKMRDETEDYVHVFKNEIMSVDSIGDDFIVLLCNNQVVRLQGDVETELFKDIRVKSIACGCGGIFALDVNGFVHVEDMVNDLAILNEIKTWNNIKQISAGPNIIAGVTQGGKVLMFSMSNLSEPGYIPGNYRNMSNHFTEIPWTPLDGWADVVKVFVTKDLDEDQPNVVYGITRSGKILIGGRVWFDKYEYYKEMVSLRNVTDIIEDGMTTLVRFNDGKIKLCCYHSEMYYEEQLAFLKKHHSIKGISMKGKFNFVAIDKDEKIYLMYGYQEQDWEYWGY